MAAQVFDDGREWGRLRRILKGPKPADDWSRSWDSSIAPLAAGVPADGAAGGGTDTRGDACTPPLVPPPSSESSDAPLGLPEVAAGKPAGSLPRMGVLGCSGTAGLPGAGAPAAGPKLRAPARAVVAAVVSVAATRQNWYSGRRLRAAHGDPSAADSAYIIWARAGRKTRPGVCLDRRRSAAGCGLTHPTACSAMCLHHQQAPRNTQRARLTAPAGSEDACVSAAWRPRRWSWWEAAGQRADARSTRRSWRPVFMCGSTSRLLKTVGDHCSARMCCTDAAGFSRLQSVHSGLHANSESTRTAFLTGR